MPDVAVVSQSNDNSNSKTNKRLTPDRAHVDRKELKFLKHVRSQGKCNRYLINFNCKILLLFGFL